MTKYLGPQDAAFLRMESKRTPMHVGALLVFQLPADAPPDFLRAYAGDPDWQLEPHDAYVRLTGRGGQGIGVFERDHVQDQVRGQW